VDNTINTTTGTFQLRANFANADEMLYPNQFVNIQLTVDVLKNAIVIPSSAIQRGAPGTFVYLVKSDDTVTVQKVVLGPSQGESQAITSGLAAGDLVVTDGADKLKNGAKVSLPTAASPAAPAPAVPAPSSDQTPAAPAGNQTPAAAAPDQTPATAAPDQTPPAPASDQTPPAPAGESQPPANSAPVNLVPGNPPQHQHHQQQKNQQNPQNGQQPSGGGQ
jgi:membrane fusion protein, multidrug efflux system